MLVITQDEQTVRVRRATDGALLTTITLPSSEMLRNAVVSADGRRVLTDAFDGQINVWRVEDGTRLQPISDALTVTDPEAKFLAAVISPDGATVATTTIREEVVRLWRVSDGQPLGTFPARYVNAAAFSPDGTLLATLGTTVQIWRLVDNTLLHKFDPRLLADHVLSFSPDGRFLAIGGGRYDRDAPGQDNHQPQVIQVWRVADGTHLQSFSVAYDPTNPFPTVDALAFSPDSTAIAAAISGEPIRTWRISDGALLRAIEHTSSVGPLAFSDDGQTLLIGGYDELYRWAAR